MVFGGTTTERLQLNEQSVWSGGPHDYANPEGLEYLPEIRRLVFAGEWKAAQDLMEHKFMGVPVLQADYQTVGDLLLTFPEPDAVTEYRRDLDLTSAIATTRYVLSNGIEHTRECFVSYPDQVIVLRLGASVPGAVTFTPAFTSPQESKVTIAEDGSTLVLDGTSTASRYGPGQVRFQARARLLAEGAPARVVTEEGGLAVHGADAVTVLISIGTNFRGYDDLSGDPAARAAALLEAAARKSYAALRADHIRDYGALYDRVTLDLGSGGATSAAPTDERIRRFHETNDPELATLLFQYGRYLLIASSRPGSSVQPANLQGLWNESLAPPWGGKFTININTEMNYWPAAPANLIECFEPLFAMIHDLSQTGQRTAQVQYGAGGWVAHHNTDAWRGTAPVDGALWGVWPTGGAWLCRSLRDHYDFTGDIAGLQRHYPVLKGAAQFFVDALVEDPSSGYLVTNPSISPENQHHRDAVVCAGPTMDGQILRDLFETVMMASETLGIDDGFRETVRAVRARLTPMFIGRMGQLQEWQEDWDGDVPEPGHRHASHVYGLYPSAQITPEGTPELFAAARRSLEMRGDAGTGWSLGWKISLWARLRDGNHAYELVRRLLTLVDTKETNYGGGGGVYANLFDAHPPFQIDGNFAFTAGICEMLLQSHGGELHLLPALPNGWPTGSVRGLLGRGGFEVALSWRDGILTQVQVHSRIGSPCVVRVHDRIVAISLARGETATLNGMLHELPGKNA
jgi:alpha-L-fucosidase 2